MDVVALVEMLSALGCRCQVVIRDGEPRLRVGGADALDDHLRAAIRHYREALIALLAPDVLDHDPAATWTPEGVTPGQPYRMRTPYGLAYQCGAVSDHQHLWTLREVGKGGALRYVCGVCFPAYPLVSADVPTVPYQRPNPARGTATAKYLARLLSGFGMDTTSTIAAPQSRQA